MWPCRFRADVAATDAFPVDRGSGSFAPKSNILFPPPPLACHASSTAHALLPEQVERASMRARGASEYVVSERAGEWAGGGVGGMPGERATGCWMGSGPEAGLVGWMRGG